MFMHTLGAEDREREAKDVSNNNYYIKYYIKNIYWLFYLVLEGWEATRQKRYVHPVVNKNDQSLSKVGQIENNRYLIKLQNFGFYKKLLIKQVNLHISNIKYDVSNYYSLHRRTSLH